MSNELATTQNVDTNQRKFICTIDTDTKEGKIKLANAMNSAESLSEQELDVPFTLVDIVMMPGKRAQSGAECINVYLIAKDGNIMFSQSEGVARSARDIVTIWGGDLGEGVEVVVNEQKLRNGNTLKTLKIIG